MVGSFQLLLLYTFFSFSVLLFMCYRLSFLVWKLRATKCEKKNHVDCVCIWCLFCWCFLFLTSSKEITQTFFCWFAWEWSSTRSLNLTLCACFSILFILFLYFYSIFTFFCDQATKRVISAPCDQYCVRNENKWWFSLLLLLNIVYYFPSEDYFLLLLLFQRGFNLSLYLFLM